MEHEFPFGTFRSVPFIPVACSPRFFAGTTQKVLFHLLSNRILRIFFISGKQPIKCFAIALSCVVFDYRFVYPLFVFLLTVYFTSSDFPSKKWKLPFIFTYWAHIPRRDCVIFRIKAEYEYYQLTHCVQEISCNKMVIDNLDPEMRFYLLLA